MAKAFTNQRLRGLKPTGKRQEYRDAGGDNLYIVVQAHSGQISFVLRMVVAGKQRKKTLGPYPAFSLAEAREKARETKNAVARGETPPVHIGPVKALLPGEGMTVASAWALYWQHEASKRKSSAEKQRIFAADIEPSIGGKMLIEVTRDELATLVSAKYLSAPTASNRLHSQLSRFFRWCHTKGHPLTQLDVNPMASVVKMHSERDTARSRYLSKQELGWWRKSLTAAGDEAPIHELLMRTLCRFSEILDLRRSEVIQMDNGDAALSLADTKSGLPQLVYLHPSAARLLPTRPAGATDDDRVFNIATRSSKALNRLRKAMDELARKENGSVQHWQPHDYRRTGVTHLAGMLGDDDNPIVADHILDRLLGHKEQRVIRHYNIHSYYREKKAALIVWNAFLNDLLGSNGID